jgi:hypothetical protein
MVQVSAAGSRDDPKSIAQSYGNAIGAEAFRVRPSFEAAARAAAPQDEAFLFHQNHPHTEVPPS